MCVERLVRTGLATAALVAVLGMTSFACVAGAEPGDDGSVAEEASPDGEEEVGEVEHALCGGSCGGWSGWYNIGTSFCSSPACSSYPQTRWQQQERYRWCTQYNGSQCQEMDHRYVSLGCCQQPL